MDADPERQANNDSIHTMDIPDDLNPPIGYHRWHAWIRAIQLLGIGDDAWWENLDRLVAPCMGRAVVCQTKTAESAEPAACAIDLTEIRSAWINLSPDRRDRHYDAAPGLRIIRLLNIHSRNVKKEHCCGVVRHISFAGNWESLSNKICPNPT